MPSWPVPVIHSSPQLSLVSSEQLGFLHVSVVKCNHHVADIQCRSFKMNAVHFYLSHLHTYARGLLQRLCGLLVLYLKHSSYNQTTAGKLATAFGPLILRPSEDEG